MELQALLLSKTLPTDVVLHHIYPQLCKNRNILTEPQKESIINDHFHLKKIIRQYRNDTSLSLNKRSSDYYMYWMENDMIGILNNDQSLINGISDSLLQECPEVTKAFLLESAPVDMLADRLYTLWTMMTPEKKRIMFERTNH